MAWADEDTWAEWVDVNVVPWERMTLTHQRLLGWMSRFIGYYVDLLYLGEVFPLVSLHPPSRLSRPSRTLPDVRLVSRAHHDDRLSFDIVEGPPDLIVEIVSDDGVERDKVEKWTESAAAGVPEYW